jgi:hypothetical protein
MLPWASMSTFLVVPHVNGLALSRGTCVAVSHGENWHIVTNRHIVTGRDQYTNRCLSPTGGVPDKLTIFLQKRGDFYSCWKHVIPLYDDDMRPTWSEHPIYGKAVDVVALPIKMPPQAFCMGVMLNDHFDFQVEVGDQVNVVGYRDGEPLIYAFPQWVDCTLKSPLTSRWSDLPAFLIAGPTRKGSSGSLVLAYRKNTEQLLRYANGSLINVRDWVHRPLGIYSGRVNEAEGVGLVWNLSCMREIVENAITDVMVTGV